MTIIEFLTLHVVYAILFLYFKKNREAALLLTKQAVAYVSSVLLGNRVFLELICVIKSFRDRYPTIKRDAKCLHISYREDDEIYDIYIPCQRGLKSRKYSIIRGSKKIVVVYPAGVPLTCTPEDLRCQSISLID
jgi:hypothetical protein